MSVETPDDMLRRAAILVRQAGKSSESSWIYGYSHKEAANLLDEAADDLESALAFAAAEKATKKKQTLRRKGK